MTIEFIQREQKEDLESGISKDIQKYLKTRNGWKGWKASDRYSKGISDRIGSFYGFMVCLEEKRPGNLPTPSQEEFIREHVENGAYGTYVTSVEQAKEFLNKVEMSIRSRFLSQGNWNISNIWIPLDRKAEIPYLDKEPKFKKIYRSNFFWQKGMIVE